MCDRKSCEGLWEYETDFYTILKFTEFVCASKVILKIHDKLQFYKASIDLEAKFVGLRFVVIRRNCAFFFYFSFFLWTRYIMYNWYYITSLTVCTSLIVFTFFILCSKSYDIKAIILDCLVKLRFEKGKCFYMSDMRYETSLCHWQSKPRAQLKSESFC